jgi:hypothetical protein
MKAVLDDGMQGVNACKKKDCRGACQDCLTKNKDGDHRRHPRSCFFEMALICFDRAANARPMKRPTTAATSRSRKTSLANKYFAMPTLKSLTHAFFPNPSQDFILHF